jgi:hypothetical protein
MLIFDILLIVVEGEADGTKINSRVLKSYSF